MLLCVAVSGCASTRQGVGDVDQQTRDLLWPPSIARSLTATEQAELEKHPLGSHRNPVRADGRRGRETYLAKLRCWDETLPKLLRVTPDLPGPYGTRADRYTFDCPLAPAVLENGEPDTITNRVGWVQVYVDEHHKGYVERRAVDNPSIRLLGGI